MASNFVGYTVLVTLQAPPGAQVQGIVSDVVNQKLFLRNVLFRWNGQRVPHYTLSSSSIAELEILPTTADDIPNEPPTTAVPASTPKASFADPAIISYVNPQFSQPAHSTALEVPVSPIMIADGTISSVKTTPALRGVSSVSSIATTQHVNPSDMTNSAAAVLTEPFDALALTGKDGEKRGKAVRPVSQTKSGIIDMKDISDGPLKAKKAGKGKGWRSTPLLEENTKPNRRRPRSRKPGEDANGWATEDATDIQDMGEFDFESNLSKFDKRRVFDDIRKDDKVAESDRLVSFNRKAKPGTNGGRNLHFSENVLDPGSTQNYRWKSEAGETEDDVNDEYYSSGKATRRPVAKQRPPPSRKGSVKPVHLDRSASPAPGARMNTASPLNGSFGARASFRLANNKPCHTVSPLQMLELEQLCVAEVGLTDEMLSENAGRSIAEAALKCGDVQNVLFLVGNHKSGARSVVAARHLRNRRLRVTVCLLGGEREEILLEAVRKQLNLYRKGGGYVERWDDYQGKLANGALTPDLVVDSLLGLHVAFDELRTDDQATAFEMIKWLNRGIATLSIDVPSGLSAASGLPSEVDGVPLMVASKHVVCLAAPKTGLLNAMAADVVESSWAVSVADIGISPTVWQKHGSRRRHGPEFGAAWVVETKLVAL